LPWHRIGQLLGWPEHRYPGSHRLHDQRVRAGHGGRRMRVELQGGGASGRGLRPLAGIARRQPVRHGQQVRRRHAYRRSRHTASGPQVGGRPRPGCRHIRAAGRCPGVRAPAARQPGRFKRGPEIFLDTENPYSVRLLYRDNYYRSERYQPMRKQYTPETAAADVETVIRRLEGRWKLIILFHLFSEKVLRYSELERSIPGISQKMLSQQLRQLESCGIVVRTLYPDVPPKVEYQLSEWGKALCPAF